MTERTEREADLPRQADTGATPPAQPNAPESSGAASPGVRLLSGRYQLANVLGYGGMAEVYKARDVRLERDVAIKILRSDLARDPTFQARFRREAQSAAALNHPTIVSVYDTGEDDKHDPPLPYIVMEYVDGRTLRDVLQHDGRLIPRRALELMIDVCAALEYSHRAGIVHRDIKPGNVMITRDGSVKVMDFGIARAVAQSTATVTQTAAVMGTAQYLSPEQARGERVDARSDLYSAGVVLYEMLTGQPPFQGESPVALAYQHVREEAVPPSDLERDLSPDIDAVVMKALAKNPGNRYQNAAEFSDDLTRILTNRPVLATPLLREPAPRPAPVKRLTNAAGRRRRVSRRRVLLAVLLVLLGAGAVIGGLLLARSPGSAQAKVQVPPVRGLSLPDAKKLILADGLTIGTTTGKHDQAKVNTVLSSSPDAGTKLDRGTAVALTFSTGPGSVQIPADLVGKSPQAAEQELKNLGFTTRLTSIIAPTRPVGTVGGTSPQAGVLTDTTTTVAIQVVNDQTTVPTLQGMNVGTAQAQCTTADLKVTILTQNSTAPDGTVLSQDLAANTDVTRGSTVTITVSHNVKPSPTPTPSKGPSRKPTPSPSASASSSPKPPPKR